MDQIICYGALIIFVIIMLLGARIHSQEIQEKSNEKKEWVKVCTTAQLKILDRYEASSWWDDYANKYQNIRNTLKLEMNSEQNATSPKNSVVSVEVSGYVYDRLKDQKSVKIYYKLGKPLHFLLEEEL